MSNDQAPSTGAQPPQSPQSPQPPHPDQQQGATAASAPQGAAPAPHTGQPADDFDGLEGKKPDELTPEELRLMADTMPGEGPGD